MGCNGAESAWDHLDLEVKRLNARRTKGKNFSEDFVVDRVCTLIGRLREAHAQKGPPRPALAVNDLRSAAEDLARACRKEQSLQVQQAEVHEVQQQLNKARQARVDLDQEDERQCEEHRVAMERHSRSLKETTLRTQLCQARLKAMEQEAAQLRNALQQPETLARVWDSLVTKLQAELDVANVEAAEAKREHDRLKADYARSERSRSSGPLNSYTAGVAVSSASTAASVAGSTAASTTAQRSSSLVPPPSEASVEAVTVIPQTAPRSHSLGADPRPRSPLGATPLVNGPSLTASALDNPIMARPSLSSTTASIMFTGPAASDGLALTRPSLSSVAAIGASTGPALSATPAVPALSATPAVPTLSAEGTTFTRSAQPSAVRASTPSVAPQEAVYGTSILQDARMALEKLEMLKAQRGTSPAPAVSYTPSVSPPTTTQLPRAAPVSTWTGGKSSLLVPGQQTVVQATMQLPTSSTVTQQFEAARPKAAVPRPPLGSARQQATMLTTPAVSTRTAASPAVTRRAGLGTSPPATPDSNARMSSRFAAGGTMLPTSVPMQTTTITSTPPTTAVFPKAPTTVTHLGGYVANTAGTAQYRK